MSREPVDEVVAAAVAGRPRSIARLLSIVESRADLLPELVAALPPARDVPYVVGITGAPGVGKSTTVSALVSVYRAQGRRVAVLAVDPTSPFTGGALLGDRVRMQEHSADSGVFIRSVATRGRLGGLAWTTPTAVRLLESLGFDAILVETVGVGQSEVDVAAATDTTLVLMAPGMGDGIQAAKAGVLEIGDVFLVNKADRDGADDVRRDITAMLRLAPRGAGDWRPRVLPVVARTGSGIEDAVAAIAAHQDWLDGSGARGALRTARARREIEAVVMDRSRDALSHGGLGVETDRLAASVATGATDAFTAAHTVLARMWV